MEKGIKMCHQKRGEIDKKEKDKYYGKNPIKKFKCIFILIVNQNKKRTYARSQIVFKFQVDYIPILFHNKDFFYDIPFLLYQIQAPAERFV